jgi:peptide/nickel transport system substrate-binding protein/oligopeptide transport system substrate-binding protein
MAAQRTRRRVPRSAALVLSLSALAVSAACGQGAGAGDAAGTFSVAVSSSYLAHLTPGQAGFSDVANAIWTPLTSIGPDGKVVDQVAQSVQSTDQQHWKITLKSGWKFQNGEPVTAQSFADSWSATAYGPNAMAFGYLMADIEGYDALNPTSGKPSADKLSGVKAVDDKTLDVTLTKPLSTFPYILASTIFAPMPKAAFGDLGAFDKLPIGNGPYQVVAPGVGPGAQQITLKRYDGYAGTKGHAASITVKVFQNDQTSLTSFRAGSVDLTVASGNDLATAQRTYPDQVVTAPSGSVVYFGFPLWDKRFSDIRVRQAFSLAIDRKTVISSLLHGVGQPATDVAPAAIAGGGGTDCASCGYDPAQAKQLLAAAGGWNGPLTLWTKQDPTMQTVVEAIANQLRTNLGISDISIQSQPTAQLYPNLSGHKTDGPFLLLMGASYPTIYSQVEQLFSPESATNVTGYRNPAVVDLLDQSGKAATDAQAVGLAQQAAAIALKDLPLSPLYYPVNAVVHAKRLGDVRIDYLGEPDLARITVS